VTCNHGNAINLAIKREIHIIKNTSASKEKQLSPYAIQSL